MYLNLNQIQLYYEIHGQGMPLILLHGNQEDHHIFNELIESLKEDFLIYAIDSRNHGQSGKSLHLSYDDMAYDVYAFIEALHINKPHILGFSDGGIIALKLAILAPNLVSKIVLLGTNYHKKGLDKVTIKALKEEKDNPFIKLMLDEPNIKKKALKKINHECLIIVGEHDCIREKHTKNLHHYLINSSVKVIKNHTHDSYIVHQDYLKPYLIQFFKNNTSD